MMFLGHLPWRLQALMATGVLRRHGLSARQVAEKAVMAE